MDEEKEEEVARLCGDAAKTMESQRLLEEIGKEFEEERKGWAKNILKAQLQAIIDLENALQDEKERLVKMVELNTNDLLRDNGY